MTSNTSEEKSHTTKCLQCSGILEHEYTCDECPRDKWRCVKCELELCGRSRKFTIDEDDSKDEHIFQGDNRDVRVPMGNYCGICCMTIQCERYCSCGAHAGTIPMYYWDCDPGICANCWYEEGIDMQECGLCGGSCHRDKITCDECQAREDDDALDAELERYKLESGSTNG